MEHRILIENGVFQSHGDFGEVAAQQARVRAAVNRAAEENRPLVLHLHGGLVDREAGTACADRLLGEYESAGGVPLFLVWQTGLVETIRSNYGEALDGPLSRWAVKTLVRKLAGKLLVAEADILSRSNQVPIGDDVIFSPMDARQFEAELEQDAEFDVLANTLVQAVEAELRQNSLSDAADITDESTFRSLLHTPTTSTGIDDIRIKQEASALRPGFFIFDGQDGQAGREQNSHDEALPDSRGLITPMGFKYKFIKAMVATVYATIRRYQNGTHHGIHATAIEELARRIYGDVIGAAIWGFMKQDSLDAFQPGGKYAGSFLLQCLQQAPNRPRVIIVGHSAGSIFACHLLQNAAEGEFEVIFLAPACTCQLFDATIASHGHKISQFRMFTMLDALERYDVLVNHLPHLYPLSLLYLISGILERDEHGNPDIDIPLLGMERFILESYSARPQDLPLLQRIRRFLAAENNRVLWSRCNNGVGLATDSREHGYFDEDPATIGSIKHIIAAGFGQP